MLLLLLLLLMLEMYSHVGPQNQAPIITTTRITAAEIVAAVTVQTV